MSENKVRFGLSNVYFAVLTEGSSNAWATPIHVPGAVNLELSDDVQTTNFRADNVTYYRTMSNNGYTGSIEAARIPEKVLNDIFGMAPDATGVIREYANVQPKPFALLYQVEGDQDEECYAFYRCVPASKPSVGSQTTGESIEPVTQSFDFTALPLVTGTANQQMLIKSHTGSTASSATIAAWFSTVNVPS